MSASKLILPGRLAQDPYLDPIEDEDEDTVMVELPDGVDPKEVWDKNRWASCVYCGVRLGVRERLRISRLWPHPVECPRCHARWHSVEFYNQDCKRVVRNFLRDHPEEMERKTPDEVEFEEERDRSHADAVGMRLEKLDYLHDGNWSPYFHEDDKPKYVRVTEELEYGGQDAEEGDDPDGDGGLGPDAGGPGVEDAESGDGND